MLEGLHILVAEDNGVNQMVVGAMLGQLGHSCELASDGLEAVAKFAQGTYDAVLMDIHMPNLDGIAAARRIRATRRGRARTPIIALTANAMVEDREAYIEAGMDDHVAKPIEAQGTRRGAGARARARARRLKAQARSSSLMLVLARLCASTRLTITARTTWRMPSAEGSVPGITTEPAGMRP